MKHLIALPALAIFIAACEGRGVARESTATTNPILQKMDVGAFGASAKACEFMAVDAPEQMVFFSLMDDPDDLAYVKFEGEHLKLKPVDTPPTAGMESQTTRFYALDYPDFEITLEMARTEKRADAHIYAGIVRFTHPAKGEALAFSGPCRP